MCICPHIILCYYTVHVYINIMVCIVLCDNEHKHSILRVYCRDRLNTNVVLPCDHGNVFHIHFQMTLCNKNHHGCTICIKPLIC